MYPNLAYKPLNYTVASLNGGIMIDKSENKIFDNMSPDMLNMYYEGNMLKKREGQLMLFNEEDDIISCAKEGFYNFFIYHAGSKIKAYNYVTKETDILISKVEKKKGTFFIYNGYMYYIGTGEYYKISVKEEKVLCEKVTGYIPTVLINCDSQTIGDELERHNYISPYFKVTYNTTSSTSKIFLPDLPIDFSDIEISFQSKKITDFTVNEDRRYIEFSRELEEGHNDLEIIYKRTDVSNERMMITNCTIAETFGGLSSGISEGTRVFLSGNSDYLNTFFYSDVKNPEYFPVNQFDILGDDIDPIMCMGKQYNGLVFFKKKSIYIAYYELTDSGVNFKISKLNSDIGCDCKYTLSTVDNQLVWLNSIWGVMTLSSTNIKDEKNVKCISENINGRTTDKGLLSCKNLEESVAFSSRGKFYIVTPHYTYVLNISTNFYIGLKPENMSWFLMDNIYAKDFLYFNKEVYLAGKNGFSYFKDVLYDFDIKAPIRAYVTTKAFDFNAPQYFKTIYDISLSLKSIHNSYIKLEIFDENGKIKRESEFHLNKFNFTNFAFPKFTFCGNLFSFIIKRRVTSRRTKYLMIKLSNDKENSQMNISDINITYSIERSVRFNGI
ncbi:MAG: hypothetical protein E7405_01185 [Ruminococcaceae bacterium]|nr:hypothetical protein [Oscillospiraceae bacterium]